MKPNLYVIGTSAAAALLLATFFARSNEARTPRIPLDPGINSARDEISSRRSDELVPAPTTARSVYETVSLRTAEEEGIVAVSRRPTEVPPIDQSGLTHEQKIQHIMSSYEEFQNARSIGGRVQTMAELYLSSRCAVAVMRESGRAIYEIDVDTPGARGFLPPPRSSDTHFIASDNAKYLVDLDEFPVVRLALDRCALTGRGSLDSALPQLTEDQLAQYEQLTDQAYRSLGVDPK